jgi:hypothetical protein
MCRRSHHLHALHMTRITLRGKLPGAYVPFTGRGLASSFSSRSPPRLPAVHRRVLLWCIPPNIRAAPAMDALQPLPAPDHCNLRHPLFTSLANPLFRHAESDNAPVMVVMLGDREAAIPLRSLQHEFGITDDSDDGRMLELIAQSLDFVACLRPGDALPAEVLSGAASWDPTNCI